MAGLNLSSSTTTGANDTLQFEPLGREVQAFQQHFDRWIQQQTERLNLAKQQHIKAIQQEKGEFDGVLHPHSKYCHLGVLEQIAVLQKRIDSAEGEEGRVLKGKSWQSDDQS